MNKEKLVNKAGLDLFFVYMHTLPNGKIYIGSTKNPYARWDNGEGYKYNEDFYNAIVQYGWDNIAHEILLTCQDGYVASSYEKMFIILLDAENPSVGYNKTNYKASLYEKVAEKHRYVLGEDENYFYDVFSNGFNPFYAYGISISESIKLIDEWIYNERDREIAKEKFLNGKTYNEISKKYNITARQTANRISNIVKQIEKHI